MRKLPDIAFIRECLDYDPASGVFTWRERPIEHFVSPRGWWQWNGKHAGRLAGARSRIDGHICWDIRLAGHLWKAHRLAWLLVHGDDPVMGIDHADGDPLNNRIANLRLATQSQQRFNARGRYVSHTGVKGVTRNGRSNGYDARITIEGKTTYLGHFATIEEAAEVRRKAAIALHGAFIRHE
jgi:hypothetical protein